MSAAGTKLYSAGPFGRFWRWQYKFTLQPFSSSSSPTVIGIGSESQIQAVTEATHTQDLVIARQSVSHEMKDKDREEMEKWKRIMQTGRQMPWSTSKARKLFQESEAAEHTNEILFDRYSGGLLGEPMKSNKLNIPNDLQLASLTTLLVGKTMSSSMPDLTALEIVLREELQVNLAEIAEKLYRLRHSRQRQLSQFASGSNKLMSYVNGAKLMRICQSLTSLRNPEVSERMLTCMTNSYFADSEASNIEEWKLRNYPEWKLMTSLTFGCILGNAYQCQAILLGFKSTEHMSRIVYQLGNHIGTLLKANLDIKICERLSKSESEIGSELLNFLPVNVLMEEAPTLFQEQDPLPYQEIIQEIHSSTRVQERIKRIVQNLGDTTLSTLKVFSLENPTTHTNGTKLLREIILLLTRVSSDWK